MKTGLRKRGYARPIVTKSEKGIKSPRLTSEEQQHDLMREVSDVCGEIDVFCDDDLALIRNLRQMLEEKFLQR